MRFLNWLRDPSVRFVLAVLLVLGVLGAVALFVGVPFVWSLVESWGRALL